MATNNTIKITAACLVYSLISQSVFAQDRDYAVVNHGVYKAIMDCKARLPLVVVYRTSADRGNAKRYAEYIPDPVLLKNNPQCHPIVSNSNSNKTYQAVLRKANINDEYDVGHLAMSNHLDDNDSTVRIANYFTNLAPQASKKNRSGGAWYATEKIVECHRDREQLLNIAGVIDDPATEDKDYFVKSFGQKTPDYWWRVVYFEQSKQYAAWLMPNLNSASEVSLYAGKYDISLNDLSKKLQITIPELSTLLSRNIKKADKQFISTSTKGNKLICTGVSTSIS